MTHLIPSENAGRNPLAVFEEGTSESMCQTYPLHRYRPFTDWHVVCGPVDQLVSATTAPHKSAKCSRCSFKKLSFLMTERNASNAVGGHHDAANISVSSDGNDDDDSLDEPESSGNVLPNYYSSHIAAVCEAVNATRKPSSPHTYGMTKQEKRREANRLSARRCRRRRRDELEELEEAIRRLSSESTALAEANAALRSELQEEVLKAQNEAAGVTSAIVPKWESTAPHAHEGSWSEAWFRQQAQKQISSNYPCADGLLKGRGTPSVHQSARSSFTGFPENMSTASTMPLDTCTLALLHANSLLQSRTQVDGALNLAVNQQRFQPHIVSSAPNLTLAQLLEARNKYGQLTSPQVPIGAKAPPCCNQWLPSSSATMPSSVAQLEALRGLRNLSSKKGGSMAAAGSTGFGTGM